MAEFRVPTLNLENFDKTGPGVRPLDERTALMLPPILRLRADTAFFKSCTGRNNRPAVSTAGAARAAEGHDLDGRSLPARVRRTTRCTASGTRSSPRTCRSWRRAAELGPRGLGGLNGFCIVS